MQEKLPDDKHEYMALQVYSASEVQAAIPLPGEKCRLCGRKVPKATKATP